MTNRKMKIADAVIWDGVVKGLGLRTRGDKITWILQTRVDGKSVKRTLGTDAALSRPEARDAARQLLLDLKASVRAQRLSTVTVEEFGARYIADKSNDWAAATILSHGHDLRVNIAPALGDIRIADLARVDVIRWLDGLVIAPGSKNRSMAVLSGILRHAELFDIRPPGSNPCKGMRRRRINFKAMYLTRTEYGRLGAAFRSLENVEPDVISLLRFLALTGARKGEARDLRWDWLDGSRFALPESKSGPRSIWLGSEALTLLNRRMRDGVFVFERDGKEMPNSRLDKIWKEVRVRANLQRLRMHDLRHSFASVAIGNGVGMRTISGLLGHRDLSSTAAYAHLQEDALRASVGRVGTHMSALLAIKDKRPTAYRQVRVIDGEVVPGPAQRGRKRLPLSELKAERDRLERAEARRKRLARKAAADKRKLAAKAAKQKAREMGMPAPKAPKSKKQMERDLRDAIVRRYLSGKLGLPAFCQNEGLDPDKFRLQLLAYRADRRAAS